MTSRTQKLLVENFSFAVWTKQKKSLRLNKAEPEEFQDPLEAQEINKTIVAAETKTFSLKTVILYYNRPDPKNLVKLTPLS